MKKLFLTILFTLVLSGGVSAKETMLTCEYKESYYRNWEMGQFGETIKDESETKIAYFNIMKSNNEDYGFETNIKLPNLRNMTGEKFESIVNEKYYVFKIQKENTFISIGIDRYDGNLTIETGHTDDNNKYLIRKTYSCKKSEQKF